MKKRAFIYVRDDKHVESIDHIASEFRSLGLQVNDVARIAGVIEGVADESEFASMRAKAGSLGVDFVPEDEDTEHRLPDPDSPLQ